MRLLLTSFGATQDSRKHESLFMRMPPVYMRGFDTDYPWHANVFMPDYAALLICEKVIMDEISFNVLQDSQFGLYAEIRDTLRALHSEGFVELVDFDRILSDSHALLQGMIDNDLIAIDQWISSLRESISIWEDFLEKARVLTPSERYTKKEPLPPPLPPNTKHYVSFTPHYGPSYLWNSNEDDTLRLVSEALKSSRKRRTAKYRNALREVLRFYLSCVNANIVLSNMLSVGIYDWVDFLPFYRQKFLSVGQEGFKEQKRIEACRQLFEVSFPEFVIKDAATLIRMLRDKRIIDLRRLVQDAVDGKVAFDREFSRSVFKEVLKKEWQTARYRKLISYVTIPIDFIPWVGSIAQKAVEEVAELFVDKRLKQSYRWFYLLGDVGTQANQDDQGPNG